VDVTGFPFKKYLIVALGSSHDTRKLADGEFVNRGGFERKERPGGVVSRGAVASVTGITIGGEIAGAGEGT
jgi:hypothetical protein